MSSTAIIVDAACDLPESILRQAHVYVMPFNILSETSTLIDDGEADCKESLYDAHLRGKAPEYAKTQVISQQNIAVFLKTNVLFKYDSAVFISVSSTRSEMYKELDATWRKMAVATIEARRLKGLTPHFDLNLIDSLTLGPGQGLLVYAAIAALKLNKSANEITKFLEKTKQTIYGYGVADDLLYVYTRAKLKNENSITWSQYALGNLLSIKPIISFRLGESINTARARGFDAAWLKVVRHLRSRMSAGLRIHIINVSYSGNPAQLEDNVHFLRLKASAEKHGVTVLLSQMSLTLALHIGQNAVMVAYSADEHAAFNDEHTTVAPSIYPTGANLE